MRRLILYTLLLLGLLLALPLNLLLAQRQAPPPLPVAPVAGHGQLMANLDLAGLTGTQAEDRVQADGRGWHGVRACPPALG